MIRVYITYIYIYTYHVYTLGGWKFHWLASLVFKEGPWVFFHPYRCKTFIRYGDQETGVVGEGTVSMSAGLGGNVGSCTSPCCGPFAPNTLANFSTSSAGSLDCNCCSSSGFLPRIPTSQPASSAVRGCKDNNTHQRFATGKHLNLMAAC